jgi:hypothetical protein
MSDGTPTPEELTKPLDTPVKLRRFLISQVRTARYAVRLAQLELIELNSAGRAAPQTATKLAAIEEALTDLLGWIGGAQAAQVDYIPHLVREDSSGGGGGGAGGGE